MVNSKLNGELNPICHLLVLLGLREVRKLRVFENMRLRRIFGPRRDGVSGDWRRFSFKPSWFT